MHRKILFLLLAVVIFGFTQPGSKEITVEKIDKAKLQKIIKDRKGKVLFLNLWATWCVPCREEFPSIVKLSNEFKDVDFVSISVDFPDEVNSKIIPFLKSNNADFTTFVSALPATFLFDKAGKKLTFLEGKQSYDEFKKEIEKVKKK